MTLRMRASKRSALAFCLMLAACDESEPGAHDGGALDSPDSMVAGDAGAPLPPCSVMAPTTCPMPSPRYGDVAPIIASRCSGCHGKVWMGPWPLDNYEHVADWADTIRANLVDCTMPPADAGVPMTNTERMEILNWIRCGHPR